jgi:hypothetical protein
LKERKNENIFIILQNAADGVANATQPRWQWEAVLPNGEVSMMLNTDFEIFFDLGELNKNTKDKILCRQIV